MQSWRKSGTISQGVLPSTGQDLALDSALTSPILSWESVSWAQKARTSLIPAALPYPDCLLGSATCSLPWLLTV